MSGPRAPAGLAEAGRKFWRSVVSVYELSPAELVSLDRACRTLDSLAAIDAEIAQQGLSVRGSRGQVIPNRMIKLRCEVERVLDFHIRSLCLPLLPDEVAGRRRSPGVAQAARDRWARERRGGEVA